MQIIPFHHALQRRSFLRVTARFAAAAAALRPALLAQSNIRQEKNEKQNEISTNERLMREHGILKRVLLMYEEVIRRIEAKEDFPPRTVIDLAEIIRKFIEDYHQKVEEEHIFPLFRNYYRRQDVLHLYAQKLLELVDVLSEQHQVGRRLTDRIVSTTKSLRTSDDRKRLTQYLRAFIRMYTPHEAREDTVLFPALPVIITPQEYQTLGETLEEIDHKTFGGSGFEIYLDNVTAFEKRLGIYDLKQFTPNE